MQRGVRSLHDDVITQQNNMYLLFDVAMQRGGRSLHGDVVKQLNNFFLFI